MEIAGGSLRLGLFNRQSPEELSRQSFLNIPTFVTRITP
jgi:hypothetical protein